MGSSNEYRKAASMGSSASGSHHWLAQRFTAIALVPLAAWFIFSLARVLGSDLAVVEAWLANPLNAGLSIGFLVVGFYHAALGLQVVIEDYVHHKGLNIAALILVRFLALILGIVGTVSILTIAL